MKVISLHKKSTSDAEIIRLLKSNNKETQAQVFEKYAPKMLGVCRQYIQDVHHAEEMMLNGFLTVFTKINQFKESGSFEGWIRKIMVNESISYLRVKKNHFFTQDDSFFKEEVVEEQETIPFNELQELVDSLREDLRIVFNLFVIEEYKHKEIANLLNITVNASKLRYRKAKQQLQSQVKNLKNYHYGK